MPKTKRPLLALLIALGALALSACGEPTRNVPVPPTAPTKTAAQHIDIGAAAGEGAFSLEAVAVHPTTHNMHALVPGVGIVELDANGKHVATIRFGENGLSDRAYLDLDILPSGRFVLAAFDESMSYDPETGTLESYFCLEPGWGPVVMENKAIGIDPETDAIFAAPAFFDLSEEGSAVNPMSAFVAQYGFDGTLIEQHDVLESGIVAEGMAVNPANGQLLVVDGSTLYTLSRSGEVLESTPLADIEDAAGLTLDADNARVLVADRADMEVRAFDL